MQNPKLIKWKVFAGYLLYQCTFNWLKKIIIAICLLLWRARLSLYCLHWEAFSRKNPECSWSAHLPSVAANADRATAPCCHLQQPEVRDLNSGKTRSLASVQNFRVRQYGIELELIERDLNTDLKYKSREKARHLGKKWHRLGGMCAQSFQSYFYVILCVWVFCPPCMSAYHVCTRVPGGQGRVSDLL